MTIFKTAKRNEVSVVNLGMHAVELVEWRRTGDGLGTTRVVTGTKRAEVNVRIDFSKLNHFAKKALRNARGRSTLADGALVFEVDGGTVQMTAAGGEP
jgi:hypothetical protein